MEYKITHYFDGFKVSKKFRIHINFYWSNKHEGTNCKLYKKEVIFITLLNYLNEL